MSETSKHTVEGGCLCGRVRYRAVGSPFNLTNCHCIICRRASGAAFVSWASFRSSGFTFVNCEPAGFKSSPKAVRTFCPNCGTPLTFQLLKKLDEIDVTICSLDNPEALAPKDHTWTIRRLSWVKLADGLPSYEQDRDSH